MNGSVIFALIAWLMSAAAYGTALVYFFRVRAFATFAALVMLSILLNVRPLMFLLGLDTPFDQLLYDDYFFRSAVASVSGLVWLAVFSISSIVFLKPMTAIGNALLPQGPRVPPARIMAIFAALFTLIAAVATFYMIRQAGSIAKFMWEVKIGKELKGSYWILQLNVLAAIIGLYGLLGSAVPARSGGRAYKRLSLRNSLFYGTLVLIGIAGNYLWGNRMNVALFMFVAGISIHTFIRPFRLRELVLGAVLAMAFLTGLGLLRNSMVDSVTGVTRVLQDEDSGPRAVSSKLHFVEFDALMLAERDAGHLFEFRLGQDFYNGLVSWIPRSIMPERETYQIGGWLRRVYEPARTNGWPATVIGDWFTNFGWPGIPLGAMISGAMAAMINGAYGRVRENAWHIMMACVLGFFLLNGGVDTGVPQAAFGTLLPLALLAVGLKLFAPAQRLPAAPMQGRTA